MTEHSRKVTRRAIVQCGFAGAVVLAGCLNFDGDDADATPDTPGDDTDADGTPDDETPDDETPTDETPAASPDEDGVDDGTDSTDDGDGGDDEPTPEPGASHEFAVETVTEDVSIPWGMAFLPDSDRMLVTERPGRLALVDRDDRSTEQVEGVPDVFTAGQGGMLDVTLHPAFPEEPWVYLTYSVENDAGESATALGRGRLDVDGAAFETFEELHVAEPYVESNGHFGSRVVFDEDERAYVTTGDRQFKDFGPDHVSQDTTNELGAILRLEADGSIPEDNPFVDDEDAVDSIYSYGHRNPQGLAFHPETDDLWETEHGEEDGDELNIIRGGENYGWPIASTACEYGTDEPVGDDPFEREDTVPPVHYWECGTGGFPPAGATFYEGEPFPNWQGDLFVGNLADQYLGRFVVRNPGSEEVSVEELDPLLADRGWRIRDVAVAPDTGHLYLAVDDDGGPVVRLVPE